MFKKIVSLLMVFTFIILSFSGCFGKPKADGSFAVPILDEPSSLDPQIANSDSEKLIITNCFEGLMTISPAGKIENGVAESYTVSDNGLVYTFNLRKDAHWALFSGHKGVLGDDYKDTFDINVYAKDFKFAFDRIFNLSINSPYSSTFDVISSYEAVDNYTFKVTLKYADEDFLYSLTTPGAMPCNEEFFNATGGKYGLDAKYLLCNGPFNVSKWVEGTSVRILRNDDYNGENKVLPSSVTFYLNNDEDAVAQKIGSGTYDVGFLTNNQYNSIQDKNDLNAEMVKNTVYSLIFNQNDKYLINKNIRLAIAYATDLSLVSTIGENISVATGIIPPFCKIGDEAYVNSETQSLVLQYNKDIAKDLFSQGLLELGASSVELDIKCTSEYETFIKQIVQTLQKTLGVKFVISVEVLSVGELKAIVNDNNYSIAFYPFTANSIDTVKFLESFSDKNIFSYSSLSFDKTLEKIKSSESNYSNLKSECKKAEKELIDDAVMIPIIFENSYLVTSADTQGIYFYSSKNNLYFINAAKK